MSTPPPPSPHPVPCHSRRLRHLIMIFVRPFAIFVLFFRFCSRFFLFPTPPRWVCLCPFSVVLDPPTGHTTARFLLVVGSLSLPSSCCLLAFRLIFLRRPYVGSSARPIIGLIVPASSNLVLVIRPAPWAHFCFVFFLLYFFLLFSVLFLLGPILTGTFIFFILIFLFLL